MITTEGYMFFPSLVGSDGETHKLKKLNHHSFFGNPSYHWLSGHCKFIVLFAQDLIVNCLTTFAHPVKIDAKSFVRDHILNKPRHIYVGKLLICTVF